MTLVEAGFERLLRPAGLVEAPAFWVQPNITMLSHGAVVIAATLGANTCASRGTPVLNRHNVTTVVSQGFLAFLKRNIGIGCYVLKRGISACGSSVVTV